MELILVILFFSVSAAICMRVFAYAKLAAARSEDLSYAVAKVASAAECFKAAGGDLAEVAGILGGETAGEDSLRIGYNEDWLPCGPGEAPAYVMTLLKSDETTAAIEVAKAGGQAGGPGGGESIFSLEAGAAGEARS